MCASKPKMPPPVAPPPEMQDAGVIAARDDERNRRRLSASNTLFTGPLGLKTPATLGQKTLLGQ